MLSNDQYLYKLEKVKLVVDTFIKGNKTIYEVSNETGITKSSVQRYLNDKDSIMVIYGANASFVIQEISRKLEENYNNGVRLGGNNFALNNESIKDKLGRFQGSRKK